MSNELQGKRVAFLVAPEGVEEVELTRPWQAVAGAGGSPTLVSTQDGEVQAFQHLDKGARYPVGATVSATSAGAFDALVLPGGVANPDQLRTDASAVAFAGDFFRDGKPVAVICHGPWTLVEADVVRGRTLTSWPSLRTDIRNAGGTWVDEQVRVDTHGPNTLVSSRKPDDLDAFCAALIGVFAEAAGSGDARRDAAA